MYRWLWVVDLDREAGLSDEAAVLRDAIHADHIPVTWNPSAIREHSDLR